MKFFVYMIFKLFMVISVSSRRILRTESFEPSRLIPKNHIDDEQSKKIMHQFPITMGDLADIPHVSNQGPSQSRFPDLAHDSLLISDILSKTREVNIFASLTREFEYLSNQLENKSKNAIVLAPTNIAIENLSHKPWESTRHYVNFGEREAYVGKNGEERAADNLKTFVEAHIIPSKTWSEEKEASTLAGQKLIWRKDETGKSYIYPGHIGIKRIAGQVSNGEVWVLDGVIEHLQPEIRNSAERKLTPTS
ncbi:hypothetical protein CPSG_09652 [Coccidioides posadasii str. Silveira]|uniref:FAS1 domain-containing protein n=3 Tax=Coccidioides posadasii TaxID=199306 RepID=E9DIK3_COCPS|nr:hypothetical protein CPSG_09652 [Coccidioides posadasii str. Silveira]KMM69793.1 FAS1 domain-containing protein [Coccidioides posadasii RMSCC 3488]